MVKIAKEVLDRIEECLVADQGASFRQWEQRVLPHIGDAYRGYDDPFREHMGASVIGRDCAREIWYSYRWATIPVFKGQILRLFNRGHLEEGRFIAMLLMIGAQVEQQDENGKQFRISHRNGLFGGSGDGRAWNLPGLQPNFKVVLEFKTHNADSFKKLQKDGLRIAKPEHWVQCNVYMRKMEYVLTLYMAVNKNNDELYAEWVELDADFADQYLDRGSRLIDMVEPPKRLSNSPGFYKCRYCDHRPVCHLNQPPAKNCRTCSYGRIVNDEWLCTLHNYPMSRLKEENINPQVGCAEYTVSKAF